MQEVDKEPRLDKWIQTLKVVHYVANRQNDDGGYTFAQWSDSSAEDTYYALQILKMLGVEPVHKNRTIDFLKRMQYDDGSYDSIKIAYYATKSLIELGSRPEKDVTKFVRSLMRSDGGFGSLDVDIEASSEIETTYFAVELLKLLGNPPQSDPAIRFILGLRNPDGSFGERGYSRFASTYHALAALQHLGFNVSTLDDTFRWVRGCENPTGGFARSPDAHDPYLVIDDIYYGLRALDILGEASRYPLQNLQLIGKFQNGNGGFRRSIFLGISTFEATYYALSSLKIILSRI